jgi:hypothetical protein
VGLRWRGHPEATANAIQARLSERGAMGEMPRTSCSDRLFIFSKPSATSRVFPPLAAGSQAVLMHGLKRHGRIVERSSPHKLSVGAAARRREGCPRFKDLVADEGEPDRPGRGSGCLGGVLDAL